MTSHEKKKYDLFIFWLYSSLVLIFFMVIVGGLTRLTNSGLSITEWELFKGTLPPFNENSWAYYFDLYKKIPQYDIVNPHMTINEFKVIFYWEYFHRLLGRFIGLFFLIPLIYFYLSKKIDSRYLKTCYLVFILITVQGIVGWYMVESGLVNNITVSHYRLSLHLTLALIIISTIFWSLLNVNNLTFKKFFSFSKSNLFLLFLFFLIFFQIIFGAFVSGLDAGRLYQTWPLMNYSYFPDDVSITNFLSLFDFDNHSLVQFYHRNLAYIITIYILILCYMILKNKIKKLYKPLKLVIVFLFLQVILGIFTLISGLNIYIASLHQIGSVILIFSLLNLYYIHVK